MHVQELAKIIGYTVQVTRNLLDRAEFADIRPPKGYNYCHNVTPAHIARMKQIKQRKVKTKTVREINKQTEQEMEEKWKYCQTLLN